MSTDPRNKDAFWDWVSLLPRNGDKRTDIWRHRISCPSLTENALAECDLRLGQPPGTTLRVLVGHNDLARARADRHYRKRMEKDHRLNADGTYKCVCKWCSRNITAHDAKVCVCADCAGGNAAYHHRVRSDAGKGRLYYHGSKLRESYLSTRARAKHKRQASTAFRKTRDDLRRAVARLERQLERDVLPLYRAKYRAERKANAAEILADQARRKTKRRRAIDPSANYENTRASRQWVWGVLQDFGYSCAYCGMTRAESKAKGFDLQIDHLFPLGHALCESGPRNAVPACISCNASKGNRDPIAWMKWKGYTPSEKVLAKIEALMPRHVEEPTQETIW